MSKCTIRAPASLSSSPTAQSRTIPKLTRFAPRCQFPVPEGGIGRVLIYKTYKDARTYMMHNEDIVWVRSLNGYRLGVILPLGFAFTSSNVAAQRASRRMAA